MSVCTAIKKIEEVDNGYDLLQVTVDDNVKAYMIYVYAESMQFLNQEVIVSYRQDVWKGKIETFINNFTIPVKVSTLDREDGFKLYQEMHDNNSNICLRDVNNGDTVNGAILYCLNTAYKNSDRAVWMEMKVRDKMGKTATLRLFDYENRDINYAGEYIKCNIRKNEYGLTTSAISALPLEFAPNPEIQIARTYIENYFAQDQTMSGIFQNTRLMDYMENYVAEERGYLLVRAAAELDILQSLKNVFNDVNFQNLAYAIMFRYGYVTRKSASPYSDLLVTLTFTLNQRIPGKQASSVLQILDVDNPNTENTKEKEVFRRIVDLADTVIRTKKEA